MKRALYVGPICAFLVGAATSYAYLVMQGGHMSSSARAPSAVRSAGTANASPLKAATAIAPQPLRAAAVPPLSAEQKQNLIESYYADVNNGDLESAYALLSPAYHAYQNYSDFAASYSAKGQISIYGLRDWPGKPTMGIAIIDTERGDSGPVQNGFVGFFNFAYDAASGQWFIDERKLTKVASQSVSPPSESAANNEASAPTDSAPSNGSQGLSQSPEPQATEAAAPQNACTPATVAEVADNTIMLDGGAKYDVVNVSQNLPFGAGDAVTICFGTTTTISKGSEAVEVTAHE